MLGECHISFFILPSLYFSLTLSILGRYSNLWVSANLHISFYPPYMQDYNQNRKGRSLRKYCKDEAVDYDWLIQYKKNYPLQEKHQEPSQDAFIQVITTFG